MAKKIVVIDDEKIVCDMAKKILEAEGYEVETFTDSQAALDRIRTRSFDLVITDLKMENVSGMDILKEVNRLYPHTRVIMLTAMENKAAATRAVYLGAVDFLVKPFLPSQVIEKLEKLLKPRGT